MRLTCLIVSGFVLFGYSLLEACSFLKRKQRESGSGERGAGGELGRKEERKTVVKLCCMREESTSDDR